MDSLLLSALLAAAAAYLAFLAYAWIAGITASPTPNSALSRRLFQLLPVCSTLGLLGHYAMERSVSDALCWTFVFAAALVTFHFPWFSAILAVCTRSPSVAIVVAVHSNPGTHREELQARGFANQTIDDLVADRIRWMVRYRLLRKQGEQLVPGLLGQILDAARLHVLRLWGLEQLGR